MSQAFKTPLRPLCLTDRDLALAEIPSRRLLQRRSNRNGLALFDGLVRQSSLQHRR